MAPSDDFEQEAGLGRRLYTKPHSGRHPIPTIHSYREHRKELESQQQQTEAAQHGPEDDSKPRRAYESVKAIFKDEDKPHAEHDPYPSTNRHRADRPRNESLDGPYDRGGEGEGQGDGDDHEFDHDDEGDVSVDHQDKDESSNGHGHHHGGLKKHGKGKKNGKPEKSATETAASALDPKEKRKAMKKTKRPGGGREVTDPITHLPIVIHDRTEKDLNSAAGNDFQPGLSHDTTTGEKSEEHLEEERNLSQRGYNGMQALFPPPDFDHLKKELEKIHERAMIVGLVVTSCLTAFLMVFLTSKPPEEAPNSFLGTMYRITSNTAGMAVFGGLVAAAVVGTGNWMRHKVSALFDDETWDAAKREEAAVLDSEEELPESVQWLNSMVASIWPLINPDLFASAIDMIEDVMQASLPKVIKMVSVDDMGQGSESVRILGIRWLPTGAASHSVSADGKIEQSGEGSQDGSKHNSQTDIPNADGEENIERKDHNGRRDGEGDLDGPDALTKHEESSPSAIRTGMMAEEGDFINLELAVAYRSRSSGKSIKSKSKNAHLYLKFYLPGGLAVPVWVEVRGFIATLRLRLQLTPDPPFIDLCTMTFLGQPKASLSCVPLSKHNLNIMDVPLISSFVQSAIDAAMAEYVAPKSLTLNLKDMLVGEDWKKDTTARGVVWIFIKQARGFRQGDAGLGPFTESTSDAYVTVSWGKFGKPVSATRIVEQERNPDWHEWASILVTPEELNAEEKLRLQLWDSDRWTADDDLGRVDLDLKYLMTNEETMNRMQDREDRFCGEDSDEKVPGTLTWSVGYFSKTRITDKILEKQTYNPEIKSKAQLKEHVSDIAEYKLRESGKAPEDNEVKQQKAQDYKEIEDNMIISAPPSEHYPSGILSIQIHNITGLEVQRLNKKDKNTMSEYAEESEHEDDMPDSYCTIVLNHRKVYKTRTKPKNSKPFFNAGTERFVKDWRTAEVMISVRDSREREDDPLIGLIFLPLAKVFANRTQLHEDYPLIGGIGYGRARVSMVWRSVELKLPQHLLGWNYGTLEIMDGVRSKVYGALPADIRKNRIKVRTNMDRIKLYPRGGKKGQNGSDGRPGEWKPKEKKHRDGAFLPVRRRYASCLIIEFREDGFIANSTAAFAVLWLHELVDEEEQEVTLKVWRGSKDALKRAESCCDYDGMHDEETHLGEVVMKLRFWRGLSGFHKSYASKSKNTDMRNVMECLDTITDEGLRDVEGDEGDDSDDSDSSDEECGEDQADDKETEEEKKTRKKLQTHANDSESESSDSDDDDNDRLKSSTGQSSRLSLSRFKKIKSIFRSPVNGGTDAALSVVAPGHNSPDDPDTGLRGQLREYKDHHRSLHRKHRGVMQWRVAREADHVGGKFSRLKGTVQGAFKHGDKHIGIETEV
ncbi:hypothetical protein PspLS_06890 [Pyricularia sp. CBS 133598]|nr:hypothetical protein PspLS_06890 [Pyricularia sp. CBS 133598]